MRVSEEQSWPQGQWVSGPLGWVLDSGLAAH